jgi:hypothetical protein
MMATSFKTIPEISTVIVADRNAQITTVILLVSEVNTKCHITSNLMHVELSDRVTTLFLRKNGALMTLPHAATQKRQKGQ